jgi:nucleoside phosphorylase
MEIDIAIYGEQNNGHGLLACSGDSALASRFVVLTDRPGDPPVGASWGPVCSGFPFQDYYVFLLMRPDPSGRRAGMVRTSAAFVLRSKLHSVINIHALFDSLPASLDTPPRTLTALTISEELLAQKPDSSLTIGSSVLAKRLTGLESKLPLLWSLAVPYLPAVAVVWANMPPSLRISFSFRFLFAPEHYTETPNTVIATLPDLANRWPDLRPVRLVETDGVEPTLGQLWLEGSGDSEIVTQTLSRFGIQVMQFNDLGLVLGFADSIKRLYTLSISEARKAVNVVARFSEQTALAQPHRDELFARLCNLTRGAKADDLLRLRNIQHARVPDLIPQLQQSLFEWIESAFEAGNWDGVFTLLSTAAADPGHWWSSPFIDWSKRFIRDLQATHVPIFATLCESVELTPILSQGFANDQTTESLLLDNLPNTVSRPSFENILKIAQEHSWMNLHAYALSKLYPPAEAIMQHIAFANPPSAGLRVLASQLGLQALVRVALETGAPALIELVGELISLDIDTNIALLDTSSAYGFRVLQSTVAVSPSFGPLQGQLRVMVLASIENLVEPVASYCDLLLACASRDGSLLLELSDPKALINRLPDGDRQAVDNQFEIWVRKQLQAAHEIVPRHLSSFAEWLGERPVLDWLDSVPEEAATRAGVNAFRSLPFLTDQAFSAWLIGLFTRTQHQRLTSEDARRLTEFLMDTDFPQSAQIVRDTALRFDREDVRPIHDGIRYKYQMAAAYKRESSSEPMRLPIALIATALPLERAEILKHLPTTTYDHERFADYATWPTERPLVQIYLITSGPGNLNIQGAVSRFLQADVQPAIALFMGVCGAVKDSNIGDVVYSTKVYSYESAREDDDGLKARPMVKETSEEMVQLAHRVASMAWQPLNLAPAPKATPAVIGAGEILFASTNVAAANYQLLKRSFNDTQVVEQEAFGFLKAAQDHRVPLTMVIRGVSDKIIKKEESDAQGNQPLASANATAFLFALLRESRVLLQPKASLVSRLAGFLSSDKNDD